MKERFVIYTVSKRGGKFNPLAIFPSPQRDWRKPKPKGQN